jgi:WD40 repeat protein
VWRVAFSPDGRTLALAGASGEIRFWDVATGKELPSLDNARVKEKHESGVYALTFSPDGKYLITTDNHGSVFFWEVAGGALRLGWKAHQFRVSSLTLSADGKILVSRGATTALVWDVARLMEEKRP